MGYGSIYHLFSRTLYRHIEKGNLRNRRAHSFEFIGTRLVLLDFILANRDAEYLEIEPDKINFFCEKLNIVESFFRPRFMKAGRKAVPRFAISRTNSHCFLPLPSLALPLWSSCLTSIPRNHLGFPDPSRSLPIALSSAPFVSVSSTYRRRNQSGHQTTFKTVWSKTRRQAKIPYFRIYDVRSTYATRLSAGGVADEWVQLKCFSRVTRKSSRSIPR